MAVRTQCGQYADVVDLRMCRWVDVASGAWMRTWMWLFRDRDTVWSRYFSLVMAALDRERMATPDGRVALAKRKARWESKQEVMLARAAAKKARRAALRNAGVVSTTEEKAVKARRAREARAARRKG